MQVCIDKAYISLCSATFGNSDPYVSNKNVVNVVNPGMCNTSLSRNARLEFCIVLKTAYLLLARTAEMGSRTILYAIIVGEESHRCYTSACKIKE
jgi:hypothetical protein